MESPQGVAGALRDDNKKARHFALTISEEELFQASLGCSMAEHFAYPPQRPLVWIKFGDLRRKAEGEMQRLAWEWVQKAGNPAISIPEVYRILVSKDNEGAYIIMQLLDAKLLSKCIQYPADDCYDLIAEGIQLLRRMPVPDDATPGPYTSDVKLRRIRHPLFKDHSASTVYRSVDELETHINQVAARTYRKAGPRYPTVSFERELTFCYCDFNDENFMFNTDAAGRLRLYIVDFEHASFLPITLLSYALFVEAHGTRHWITAEPLVQRIGHTLPRSNLDVLAKVGYTFVVSASVIALVRVGDGASATWRVSESKPVSSQSATASPSQYAADSGKH